MYMILSWGAEYMLVSTQHSHHWKNISRTTNCRATSLNIIEYTRHSYVDWITAWQFWAERNIPMVIILDWSSGIGELDVSIWKVTQHKDCACFSTQHKLIGYIRLSKLLSSRPIGFTSYLTSGETPLKRGQLKIENFSKFTDFDKHIVYFLAINLAKSKSGIIFELLCLLLRSH